MSVSNEFWSRRRPDSMPAAIEPVADSVLIDAVAAGNDCALSIIYDRYSALLYGMLVRILKDEPTAEEVLQDLFLQIWRNPHQFGSGRRCLRTWLFVMGRDRAISRLRSGLSPGAVERRGGDQAAALVSRELEDGISISQVAETVRKELLHLPLEQRQALELAYFDGLSQDEIAALTGSQLELVRSRTRMALQSLRQSLEGNK